MSRKESDQLELQLIEKIATRDRVAFETFYGLLYPRLNRYLGRLLRRPEMVEEVLNDTMFVVWEKASTFQGRSKVSTWVTGIAYLKGIKALDRLRMMPDQNPGSGVELDQLEENDNLIRKLGLDEWLTAGLEGISPEQRSVVELTYFAGYSYTEISEIMGCPVNTVKTRMFHARRKLEKLLPILEKPTVMIEESEEGEVLRDSQLLSVKDTARE